MNKIVLSTLLFGSLLSADQSVEDINMQIGDAKAQVQELQTKITKLKAALPVDESLTTHTELGYIETQGNTRTKTFSVDLNAKKPFGNHEFSFDFDAQYATDQEIENKNKYASELNYDYSFSKRFSFNYLAGYNYDKFSSFHYQAYTGPGAKFKAIKSENHDLSLEASILYAQDDLITPDEVNSYTAYRAKGVYKWKVLDNLKFKQELSYRANFDQSDNYFITSKSSLTNKISDVFSAGINYKVDYVNQPGTFEYSDRTFTANLIIDY